MFNQQIPVVFFHIGDQDYFSSSLRIALKNNHVIHIGDSPRSLDPKYRFVDFREVSEGFKEFASVYQHYSFNPLEYERICFLRWIALMNLMRKEGISRTFYSDSDVAVLDDVSLAFDEIGRPETSFVVMDDQENYRWSACGLSSYWTVSSIEKMCEFIFSSYTDPLRLTKLQEKASWHMSNKIPGGVCDMTVFYLFTLENDVFPINRVIDNTTFDQNVNDSENFIRNEFIMIEGKKKITREGNLLFGETSHGEKVRFRTIHCQGNAKAFFTKIEELLNE
jgi:hypothetical protein